MNEQASTVQELTSLRSMWVPIPIHPVGWKGLLFVVQRVKKLQHTLCAFEAIISSQQHQHKQATLYLSEHGPEYG